MAESQIIAVAIDSEVIWLAMVAQSSSKRIAEVTIGVQSEYHAPAHVITQSLDMAKSLAS